MIFEGHGRSKKNETATKTMIVSNVRTALQVQESMLLHNNNSQFLPFFKSGLGDCLVMKEGHEKGSFTSFEEMKDPCMHVPL